jgi:hypothetical protein
MPVPAELQPLIVKALGAVEQHPQHEYGPLKRKHLMTTWRKLEHPRAHLARRWLALITGQQVLPRFVEPDYPPSIVDELEEHLASLTPDELHDFKMIDRYVHPEGALALAEQVILGSFDRDEAFKIACRMHYLVGKSWEYQPVYAVYVEGAANRSLVEVSRPDDGYDAFHYLGNLSFTNDTFALGASVTAPGTLHGEQFTDTMWVRSGQSDCAAEAAIAWSCGAESKDPEPDKLLEFWRWWLTDAIPQAWAKAEEQAT